MAKLNEIDLTQLTPTKVNVVKVVDTNVPYEYTDENGNVKKGTSALRIHHYVLVEDETLGVIPLEITFKNDRYMLSKDLCHVNVKNGVIVDK